MLLSICVLNICPFCLQCVSLCLFISITHRQRWCCRSNKNIPLTWIRISWWCCQLSAIISQSYLIIRTCANFYLKEGFNCAAPFWRLFLVPLMINIGLDLQDIDLLTRDCINMNMLHNHLVFKQCTCCAFFDILMGLFSHSINQRGWVFNKNTKLTRMYTLVQRSQREKTK